MKELRRLMDAQHRHIRDNAGKMPRRVLMGSKQFCALAVECSALFQSGRAIGELPHLLGMEVIHKLPTEFCQNCGAPTEPHRCSYCGTAADLMEFMWVDANVSKC